MPVSLNNNVAQVTNTQPKKQLETKSETKSSISTGVKVAVGTGLAALAAIGIYVATRGKSGRVPNNTQETANTIKEMTVDAFKKAGNKFNKGKAVISTGEAFTGKITSNKKDGTLVMRNYKDGLLDKVDFYKDKELLYSRIYKYDTKGLKMIDKIKDGSLVSNPYTKTVGVDGFPLVNLTDKNGCSRYVRSHYKECGMVDVNGDFCSLQNNTRGHFQSDYQIRVPAGYKKNSTIINGHIFPDHYTVDPKNPPGLSCPILDIFYDGHELKNARKHEGIRIHASYESNNANCEFLDLDIDGKFNNTSFYYDNDKLSIGDCNDNKKPICKYNFYTKEISDLKDEKAKEKVEQIIDFIERHYDSYKKALELDLSEKEAALKNGALG